ncbi:MAG: nitroreductase family protein [Promethearchaeota archaeon]
MPEFDLTEKQKLGTYRVIEGVQNFIVVAVEKSKYDQEHFGYIMELIILVTTSLGLGMCWLEGTFKKSLFSAKVDKKENENIPAITPIGYPAPRKKNDTFICKSGYYRIKL